MDVRTFVSIPVPNTAGFEPLIRELRGVRGARLSPGKQMHITLKFLGDIPEERLDDVERAVNAAVAGLKKARITVRGVGAFPSRRNPKVLWAGVETDLPLAEISDRIARGLDGAGLPYDGKPFKPHITVARLDRNHGSVDRVMSDFSGYEFASFVCPAVLVMKSELRPTGAEHTIARYCELRRELA